MNCKYCESIRQAALKEMEGKSWDEQQVIVEGTFRKHLAHHSKSLRENDTAMFQVSNGGGGVVIPQKKAGSENSQ